MDNFSCSPITSVQQYIILFDDELMSLFVENRLINSCGLKTNCRISLAHKVLNRSVRPGFWNRYFIINVVGADHFAIERCNRLLERHIPQYRMRQRYRCKSHVTLYTNEWLPDNSPVCEAKMRMGPQRSQFGNLKIFSPYANHKFRTQSQTPWKISSRENLGHYEFADIYRPILSKSNCTSGQYPLVYNTSYKDVAKFNLPNSFDRYTTFKAIDNENINLSLQQRCLKFMDIMNTNKHEPISSRYEQNMEQSCKYVFESNPSLSQLINEKSTAITSKDPIYSQLENPDKYKGKYHAEPIKKIAENVNSLEKNVTVSEHLTAESVKYKPKHIESLREKDKNSERNPTLSDRVLVEENSEMNKNNQSDLLSDQNQNFITTISMCDNCNIVRKSKERTKNKRLKRRTIKYNRYIRLYNLKSRQKCINYRNIESKPIKIQSESDVTFISSNFPSKEKTSTKASKSSHFDDDTLDSLRSF